MSDKAVFRCPQELKDRVEALAKIRTRAEGEEVSASDIYRQAIKLYLRHMEESGNVPTFTFD
jgi:predicted DNA-binding protein